MRRKWGLLMAVAGALLLVSNAGFAQLSGETERGSGASAQTGQYGGAKGTPESGMKAGQEPGTMKGTRRTANVRQELEQNPALSSKLEGMLPAGTSVQDAASGFKSVREFAATVHLSHQLNIPFDQLKTKVTGGQSLEQAVRDLKPGTDAKAEVKKARDQAREDIKSTRSKGMKGSGTPSQPKGSY